MYAVSCRDLGFADCDFVAEGKNARKIKDQLLNHARDEHPELLIGITMEKHEQLERLIEQHMVAVAA